MKKTILMVIMLGLSSLAFAQTISTLYQEFQRRDAIVFSLEEGQVFNFLRNLKYDVNQIKKLEFIDPQDFTKFVFEAQNGDVCFGDINLDLLRCKNSMGLTTIQYDGDAD